MKFTPHALAIAAGLVAAGPHFALADAVTGKRVDNARVQVDPAPPATERRPAAPYAAPSAASATPAGCTRAGEELPFRITVDGQPLEAAQGATEADRQRCVDLALEQADIQVRFDSLAVVPALNLWAVPASAAPGEAVEFRAWSNYLPWIRKAEIRIFAPGQTTQQQPLETVPLDWSAPVRWVLPAGIPHPQLAYVLRVYDDQGRFDETTLKPLHVLARPQPGSGERERDELAGYGENTRWLANIPVRGGTLTVNGTRLKPGQRVHALGVDVPVDQLGQFAIKQIVPAGPQSVEIRVQEPDGRVASFRRNLSIAQDDWFYLALGDLTVGRNNVAGPARLVTSDLTHYEDKVYVDGRAAFYLKGKIKGEWLLTASADTREGPLKDMFSNFSEKDPRYLLRSIDPDLYYPVYGDDSTTVDDAPTQGKFFVKLQKDDSHVMWGNFQTAWTGTELTQYSRGLYGAHLRHRSLDTTSLGEKKLLVDAFVADPGTIGAREEFKATGGSLYYLRHMDVTQGSERVWVEVRDRDSGRVLERRELSPAQDYEINYLQGRILLQAPLSSTSGAGGVVMPSSVGGNPVYLVTTYEFVPGLTRVDNLSTGLRASHWLNDHFQVGVSTYHQGEAGASQTLKGIDGTLRYKPGTWLKFEAAESSGAGSGVSTSIDGGFGFGSLGGATAGDARAYRLEGQADLREVTDVIDGKVSAYVIEKDRGYSGPGQITSFAEAVQQHGLSADVTLRPGTAMLAKADQRQGELQDSRNVEIGVRQALGPEWEVTVAARADDREDVPAATASPILSQTGERTDAQVRLAYLPEREGGKPGEKAGWDAYGYVQGTLERDETRDANDRVGLGGHWEATERVRLGGEVSAGSLGSGGKASVDYRVSEASTAYLTYALETESEDVAWRGRQGTLVSGLSTRVGDGMRLFGEARHVNGAGPQSLTQAFGLDWAASERWNWGAKVEWGTVSDELSGDLRRHAVGATVGYAREGLKYSGGLEWRHDRGTLGGTRTTWLMRNNLGWQVDPAWRMLAKLNIARSRNSQGTVEDGNFREFVLGSAWRPVTNDRWNTLFKYTSFHNVPTAGQLLPSGEAADYAQRSHVFAVDTIYDVVPWLSVGGKYAFRVGELKAPVAGGQWFSSRAHLVVLRADLHLVKEWDALVEWRKLRATEAADARSGVLLGVYRHLGKSVKAGVGYNFTNYSDDLTDLSYRSRGWFVNVLATY